MESHAVPIGYVLSGSLIIAYAWGRFNTPPSARSSTRQSLYWWSCSGYLTTALALFACLSMVLEFGPWREALLGPADKSSLPAPLIATLAMTTLTSSVPMLRRLDAWLLACFHDWGEIPAEVTRRAAAIQPEDLSVTEQDVATLQERYGDGSYGQSLANHLRANRGEGMELSQYRFTRVVKLYDGVRRLAGEERYARFFAESADAFSALEKRVDAFLRVSDASLTVAARLRAAETAEGYEDLMHERRETFAANCRAVFRELAQFLAHAVLRSEASEADIVDRLRAIGFSAAGPMNQPDFPIDSLTLLGVGVFIYLAAVTLLFNHLTGGTGGASHVNQVTMSAKIALSRLVSVGVVVLLIQRHAFFRRAPGQPHRHFAYLVNGLIGSAAAAAVCLLFLLHGYFTTSSLDLVERLQHDIGPIAISGMVCTVVAFCCNDWVGDAPPPRWLRVAEALGCGAAVAVGLAIMIGFDLLPSYANPVLVIVFPSLLTMMIGGTVPHIYRSAARAAAARAEPSAQTPLVRALPREPGPPGEDWSRAA